HRYSQFVRDPPRLDSIEDDATKGRQRGLLEHRLDQLQQAAQNVLIVFLVPAAAEFAVGVLQKRQRTRFQDGADRLRLALERMVVGERPVSRDGTQPAPKGAFSLSLEARQLPDEDGQDILNHVLGLAAKA